MRLTNQGSVPVYTISGSSTARPLPEWLAKKRKRSLKNDPEYANRVELLQDFEFEEASQCIRVSEDGNWVMSTGAGFRSLLFFPGLHADINAKGPTSRRFIRTICRTCHCLGLVTQYRSIPHFCCCLPITQNRCICSLIGRSSFTPRKDAIIR